jgi:hypothetical protein
MKYGRSSNGMFEEWNTGMMEERSVGTMVKGSTGIMEYWNLDPIFQRSSIAPFQEVF